MMDQSVRDDKELFILAARGNVDAFTKLFNTYSEVLYSYVIKILKSDIWAEEIVQEVWTQVWLKKEEIGEMDNPVGYIHRMASNKTIDWIRRNRLDLKAQYHLALESSQLNKNITQEQMDFNNSTESIRTAINNLPEQRKKVFQLKYLEGLSYDEIALHLQISKNTVRNQMVKALQAVRDHLKANDNLVIFLFILCV